MTMHLPAFAKINLDLRVLGVRPDGYHELRTVFQTLRLHDTLTFVRRPGPLTLTCRTPGVPTDHHNLVWKAAAGLWRERFGARRAPEGVAVHLVKRIPAEAGLGGGSADAAAALRGLDQLWSIGADEDTLVRVASGIGADVPFLLRGGTALGLGRGDAIYPLEPLPSVWVALVRPPFGVSTVEAYRWWDADPGRSPRTPVASPPPAWPHWARILGNDLEPPVARRHPTIARIRRALLREGAFASAMSGSGSTVFGLFTSAARARAAVRPWQRPGWLAVTTRTGSRDDAERSGIARTGRGRLE
ncbi:MAG: 4-(cytidine 5'-diphospho)-2-C-methyl-D-erythritol kinase [Acidobacteria bacterium]|nr:4-(cytidine 5'-diphospho)-2-C-methyl-D-erythritol kinase [Acidobacteriota bacterium]